MCANSRDEVVTRGEKSWTSGSRVKQYIKIVERTGKNTAKITSKCHHIFCPIIEHPMDPNLLLEACEECEVIRCYNINTAESKTVYTGCKPEKVCIGSEGYVFVIDVEGELIQLQWREEKEELELANKIQNWCEGFLGNVLRGTIQHPGHHL